MSSTAGNGSDQWQTPPALARAIVRRLHDDGWTAGAQRIIEPGCGRGSFCAAFLAEHDEAAVYGYETDHRLAEHALQATTAQVVDLDFLQVGPHHQNGPVDVIGGNWPFSLAEPFLAHAMRLVRPGGVVFSILRLGFLEAVKRQALLAAYPLAAVYALTPRPSFLRPSGEKAGSDSAAYGVFVWRRSRRIGPCVLEQLAWSEGELLTHAEVAAATGGALPAVVHDTAAAMQDPITVVKS